MKIACVVQGDIRRGTDEVLNFLSLHFDTLIFSTWEDQQLQGVPSKAIVVQNKKPQENGLSNRNMQRKTSAAGIHLAKEIGCTHVLKWRSDMLPTNLNLERLLEWSSSRLRPLQSGRIVTCFFRNLTANPDPFSSIPDVFSFGPIDLMMMLWGDEDFDYSAKYNFPVDILKELGVNDPAQIPAHFFAPESELFVILKSRLQRATGENLNHCGMIDRYFYLIDHEKLKICWFHPVKGFRPIVQAREFPWWTEKTWRTLKPIAISAGYPMTSLRQHIMLKSNKLFNELDQCKQKVWYFSYSRNKSLRFQDKMRKQSHARNKL